MYNNKAMKNLITIGIEKLEELPIESLSVNIRKKDYREHSRRYRFNGHSTDGVSPWKRAERIIEKNIGKSFNKAFSKYCSQVPVYQQRVFLDEFNQNRRWRRRYYYTDKNGCIQRIKQEKKKLRYKVESTDAVWEKRHKITGQKIPEFLTYRYEKYNGVIQMVYYMKSKKYGAYKAVDKDFEPVLIKGSVKYFKSKKDPEYQRYMSEYIKVKERGYRDRQKQKDEKAYPLISAGEIAIKKRNNI